SIQAKLRVEAGDRIFFAPGSAELGSRARVALAAQAQWLIRWHKFETAIEGHADEPGTDEENVSLSVQRAEAVRQRLIAEGVDPARIAIVPMGRAVRLATCADVECRAQNRRAVTLVFAGGTHHRLGLVTGGPRSAEPDPKVSVSFPEAAPDGAILARPVGVAR
ncbi:MAG TPA: OmpA family protein, partial [Hyphomicrobium sp.]|nr:OmpA family protein [Hyphomicrobium sp.]